MEGRTQAKAGGRNEPSLPGDGEEPGLGGGQVHKPEGSVMKRLVRGLSQTHL